MVLLCLQTDVLRTEMFLFWNGVDQSSSVGSMHHQLTIMSSSEVGRDLFHAILIAHTVLGLDKPIILKPHQAATQDFQMLKFASLQILLVCSYLKQNYHQAGSGVSACKGSSSFTHLTCHPLRVMNVQWTGDVTLLPECLPRMNEVPSPTAYKQGVEV